MAYDFLPHDLERAERVLMDSILKAAEGLMIVREMGEKYPVRTNVPQAEL